MAAMRAAVLAALVLLLALAGCGGSASQTGAELDGGAAHLVPPDAKAFVQVDTHFDSAAWREIAALLGPKLDLADLKDAAGDGLSLAVLGKDAVAFAKPEDEAKLRRLAARFDEGGEHYAVQKIGDWSVVADSDDTFAAVRSANSGRSLADTNAFEDALAQLHGDAIANAYIAGDAIPALGTAKWFAAQVTGDDKALELDVHAQSLQPAPPLYRPTLLHDVPSGAVAAVSFKDLDTLLPRLHLSGAFAQLLPAVRGEGSLYVLQGTLLPTFALEVQSPDPTAAERALRQAAAQITARFGAAAALRVARYGRRVVLTNAAPSAPTPAGALVDDPPFKDALAAADVPERVSWLAYADVQRLKPFLQLLMVDDRRLDKLGTLVAYATPSRLVVRATLR
jgi:hypothetical protein